MSVQPLCGVLLCILCSPWSKSDITINEHNDSDHMLMMYIITLHVVGCNMYRHSLSVLGSANYVYPC